MKIAAMHARLFIAVVTLASPLRAATIADYARPPEVSLMRLSPDGAYLAFRAADEDGRQLLRLLNLQTREVTSKGIGKKGRGMIRSVTWVSAQRLVIHISEDTGVSTQFAVNRDGSEYVELGGDRTFTVPGIGGGSTKPKREPYLLMSQILHAYSGNPASIVALVFKFPEDWHTVTPGRSERRISSLSAQLARVNTVTDEVSFIEPEDGVAAKWILDEAGRPRARVDYRDGDRWPRFRATADGEWLPLPQPAGSEEPCTPVGLHPADDALLVAHRSPDGLGAIHRFDPVHGEMGPAIVADPHYDILGASVPFSEETPPVGGVRDLISGQLAGWRYLAPEPVTTWFLPDLAWAQEQVDAALPHSTNLFLGWSADRKIILLLAASTVDSGTYHIFLPAEARLVTIGPLRGWLPASARATVEYRRITARDGLEIPARLTWPPSPTKSKVPLVVVIPDGPNQHMGPGFDPLLQCLANHGFALLEVDPRGSSGYGESYSRAGRREHGGAIEQDIEDAVRSALAEGRIDPDRVAILGQGIGGISVCHALARSAIKYRCGVTIDTPGDWISYLESQPDDLLPSQVRQTLIDAVGDPVQDAARLRAISPVSLADGITVPLLLIEKERPRLLAGEKSSRTLVAALRKTKPKPTRLVQPHPRSSTDDLDNRRQLLERVTDFLRRELD